MFPTEVTIKNQCKTRPTTAVSSAQGRFRNTFDELTLNSTKYKQAKLKMKQVLKEFQQTSSNVRYLRKSIDMAKSQIKKKQRQFNRFMIVNKIKVYNQEAQAFKNNQTIAFFQSKHKQTQIGRLTNKLQKQYDRIEQQKYRQTLRSKNKRERNQVKSQIQRSKTNLQIQAKIKYQRRKQNQFELKQKLRKIQAETREKGKNYKKAKIGYQKYLIQQYEKILNNVQQYNLDQEPPTLQYQNQNQNKSTFITCQKSLIS